MLPAWFALGGLFFATWLAVFFHDSARPNLPQERADRLAAQNYLAAALSAPTPPSPAHWAQLLVWQDPGTGARHPAAREAAALVLAATGGRPRVSGVVAFGLAAAALGWLLCALPRPVAGTATLLGAGTLLAVAHGRAWQMSDPAPYLILAASALSLGAWWRHRSAPSPRVAWILGFGVAAMFLCAPALGWLLLGLFGIDLARLLAASSPAARRPLFLPLSRAILVLGLLFLALTLRNHATTGDLLYSPERAYNRDCVTAPHWFWEMIRLPPVQLDPVIERYDELVAIPAARWESPVYRAWLNRLTEGIHYAAGIGVALGAFAVAMALPSRDTRPAWLICIGMAGVALVRYPLSSSWWAFASPALLALVALGLARLHAFAPALPRRLLMAGAFLQVAFLGSAPMARPTEVEYQFAKQLEDVAKKLNEKPGRHLVFVQIDDSADPRLEPADLPRDWTREPILYARDLKPEQNAELVAALPTYTPWTIVVLRDRIGLKPWTPPDSPRASRGGNPAALP